MKLYMHWKISKYGMCQVVDCIHRILPSNVSRKDRYCSTAKRRIVQNSKANLCMYFTFNTHICKYLLSSDPVLPNLTTILTFEKASVKKAIEMEWDRLDPLKSIPLVESILQPYHCGVWWHIATVTIYAVWMQDICQSFEPEWFESWWQRYRYRHNFFLLWHI